jgi:hypothetical protein
MSLPLKRTIVRLPGGMTTIWPGVVTPLITAWWARRARTSGAT